MFTIDYVNNTIWTPTLREDYSCHPLRMCPTEGTTRDDRASRSVSRTNDITNHLTKKRFLLHARKEKPNCHRDKMEGRCKVQELISLFGVILVNFRKVHRMS